ncbi:innexin unc-9-like, partial [Mytilus edulis]|uniref:innexin unc-9-like n=1 Tax=Mytilus edulis TaxID=6550 RepID=UPI0039F0F71D
TDDSRIHLLNRLYYVVVLIVFVVIVSAKQYVGEPIPCWCPAVFEKSHVAYSNYYCWVSNTYYVDFESSLPIEREIRVDKEIEYYQWVPLIFLLQALLFYLPRMVWKRFGGGSYMNVKQILRRADEAMTNVQTWTVQCSLPINLFNEKIFCINWMMLVSMVLINGTHFLYNLVAIFLPFRNRNYVRKFLDMEGIRGGRPEEIPEYEENLQQNFVFEYLRHDGVFLIWFVSNKTNQVIASEIVIKLWKNYVKSKRFKEQNNGL